MPVERVHYAARRFNIDPVVDVEMLRWPAVVGVAGDVDRLLGRRESCEIGHVIVAVVLFDGDYRDFLETFVLVDVFWAPDNLADVVISECDSGVLTNPRNRVFLLWPGVEAYEQSVLAVGVTNVGVGVRVVDNGVELFSHPGRITAYLGQCKNSPGALSIKSF